MVLTKLYGLGEEAASQLLSSVDIAAGVFFKYLESDSRKFFRDGIGGNARYAVQERAESRGVDDFEDIDIQVYKTDDSHPEYTLSRGSFKSPLHEYLEDDCNKSGYVEIVEPKSTESLKGVLVMFPMTGDQGFFIRRQLLAAPLAKRGFASVVLMVPYYGKRVPSKQTAHYNRTMDEFALLSLGGFLEGAKLFKWVREHYKPGVPVGATGLSLGGIVASGAASFDNGDLVLVPCLANDSAQAAFFEGVLRGAIAKGEDSEELKKVLGEMSISTPFGWRASRPDSKERTLIVRQINAKHDRFLTKDSTHKLRESLQAASKKHTQVEYLGGHSTLIASSRWLLVPQIEKAFEEYQELKATSNTTL